MPQKPSIMEGFSFLGYVFQPPHLDAADFFLTQGTSLTLIRICFILKPVIEIPEK
jgi:hypothetical protein